jgi:hypothetical protein
MDKCGSDWHRANKKRKERHYKYQEMSKERRLHIKRVKEGRRAKPI